jgi:tetratricopeptide (TPR) repeat protein
LLTPVQQELFRHLAVFRGAFSAAAAVAITGCRPAALAQLCAYSLLQALDNNPTTRYAMHEVLHQYAAERLQIDAATEKLARTAHSRYYLTLVADQETLLNGSKAAQSVALLGGAFENIRAGWQWAGATHDLATLQQATHGLLRYFVLTSQAEEGGSLFAAALHHVEAWLAAQSSTAGPTFVAAQPLLADLHALRARLYFKQARYAEGIDHAERALLIAEDCDAAGPAALANLYWGICLMNQGEYAGAEQKLTAALERARAITWHKVESDALRGLGILADMQDNLADARHFYTASLALSQGMDDPRGTSASLGNLGTICRRQGDFVAARHFLEESLTIHRMIGDRSSEGRTLTHLGELSVDLEEYGAAERYFGEAIHRLQRLGEDHHAADALVALGKLYHAQGQRELAVACWAEAAPIYEAANELPQLAEVQAYFQLVNGTSAPTTEQKSR